ncbi:MAG: hypothetical protein ABW199_03940 [Caulobacterales bacterium]
MTKMKFGFAAGAAVLLMLSVAACGQTETTVEQPAAEAPAAEPAAVDPAAPPVDAVAPANDAAAPAEAPAAAPAPAH